MPKFVLGTFLTFKRGKKRKYELKMYLNGQGDPNKEEVIQLLLSFYVPGFQGDKTKWIDLVRWFERTHDLPGAIEAYNADPQPVEPQYVPEADTPMVWCSKDEGDIA